MTFEQKISQIRGQLQKPLPGKKQQYLMAPEFRREPIVSSPGKNAAVMICLFPGDIDIQIVFIKRSEYDGPHGGQISFPGGVQEEKDMDLAETAIRETMEEIGVYCEKSAILGSLTPLAIPISNMNVQPFVGFYDKNPDFTIEKREVDYIILATLDELSDPHCVQKEKWKLQDREIDVPFYRVNGNIIWGATAMILCEFLAVISGSGLNPKFRY